MKLWSPSFANGGAIPSRHAKKDGSNVSPPLEWSDVPAHTQSLALIVDDPDAPDPKAPKMTWVHWVLYNIPPTLTSLAEGNSSAGTAGHNDWKQARYDGPAPPIGKHRYFFKLYALDVMLHEDGSTVHDKPTLLQAIEGHVLDQAELVGTYEKKK